LDLSIVIVNYNVKHFLEQCLHSVKKATQGIKAEVIVVDNNSADGSCSMMLEKFSEIKLIRNSENLGFSAANNQALKKAKGKFVLLLNPDTIIHEDSLTECLSFMEKHRDAGAIGLKMIDGKGNFLPESKRSLPTPQSAFYKIFGLAALFPKSEKFNTYYLKHLDKDNIQKIDILTGAFMFIRASALEKCGLLDEDFFMYAEDIDLSYRLSLKGYQNYYLPSPAIIHFKGESTKKSEFNYPRHFYGSMIRFVRKYYSGRKASNLSSILRIAILLKAMLSVIKVALTKVALPIIDIIVLSLTYLGSVKLWETIKYEHQYEYPEILTGAILPAALFIVIAGIFVLGGYRRKIPLRRFIPASAGGSVLILIAYSLLPSELRFSRAIILLWSLITPMLLVSVRLLLNFMRITIHPENLNKSARVIIISGPEEFNKIEGIVFSNRPASHILGRVSVSGQTELNSLGMLEQIDEVVRINKPDELIFSSKDLSAGAIISLISQPGLKGTEKKIACSESDFVIGSNNSSKKGEVYSISKLRKSLSD